MLYFRFKYREDINNNYWLVSLNSIKPIDGQHWVKLVGGKTIPDALNQYVPSDGVVVLFQVESDNESANADQGRLLKFCHESELPSQ